MLRVGMGVQMNEDGSEGVFATLKDGFASSSHSTTGRREDLAAH